MPMGPDRLDREAPRPVFSAIMNAPIDKSDADSHADPLPENGQNPALPTPREDWALFLDVDGTLVELAARPDAIHVDSALIAMLSNLNTRLGGAIALVSGRSVEMLDQIFAPLRLPAGGNHGLERRGADGVIHRPLPHPAMEAIRCSFTEFSGENEGCLVEDKLLSIALHYRLRPSAEADARALAHRLCNELSSDLSGELDGTLVVQYGKMMVEVRPGNADKGSVIETLMTAPPFAGRLPVFIGDDVTDEAGFLAINARAGHSIRVGNGAPTAARFQLENVASVVAWLTAFSQDTTAT